MKEYMLVFRHDDITQSGSSEEAQCVLVQTTMDWLARLAATSNFEGKGNGLLFNDAHVVHHNNIVTNGPFGEIKETLGGYVIVKANSAAEAVEFAKGCPILTEKGNTVEVRSFSTNVEESIKNI